MQDSCSSDSLASEEIMFRLAFVSTFTILTFEENDHDIRRLHSQKFSLQSEGGATSL